MFRSSDFCFKITRWNIILKYIILKFRTTRRFIHNNSSFPAVVSANICACMMQRIRIVMCTNHNHFFFDHARRRATASLHCSIFNPLYFWFFFLQDKYSVTSGTDTRMNQPMIDLHVSSLTCIKQHLLVQHLPKGGFQVRQEFRVESDLQFGRVFLHFGDFFTVSEHYVHQTWDIVVSATHCVLLWGVPMQTHKTMICCQSSESVGWPVSSQSVFVSFAHLLEFCCCHSIVR